MNPNESETRGTVTVEEPRPRYAWVFDIAIAGAIGLTVAAALVIQHRNNKRLSELVEMTRKARRDAMVELEVEMDDSDTLRAGDSDGED